MEEKTFHKIIIRERSWMEVFGVNDVISVDAEEAVLDTQAGLLHIKGTKLHVKRLNLEKGELDLEGMVDSVVYTKSSASKKESFVSRIFR